MKIHISAENERHACIFAQRIRPHLERTTGKPIVAAALCTVIAAKHLTDSVKTYIPIDSWRFPDASKNVVKLAKEGINLIILSAEYLEWKTDKDAINEDLESFEKSLEECGMTTIEIAHYDDGYTSMFEQPNIWQPISTGSIISMMAEDYINESFVLPWGMLPYFLVEPLSQEELEEHTSIKVFAGFQPQTYARFDVEQLWERFPYIHWLPEEYVSLKAGPIPFICNMSTE